MLTSFQRGNFGLETLDAIAALGPLPAAHC
jgi:hypothetical protein